MHPKRPFPGTHRPAGRVIGEAQSQLQSYQTCAKARNCTFCQWLRDLVESYQWKIATDLSRERRCKYDRRVLARVLTGGGKGWIPCFPADASSRAGWRVSRS
jgi:hypothetical protein